MTDLWLDRSNEIPAGAPRTHALVIGVSAYPNLPSKDGKAGNIAKTFGLRQVESPASSAILFARWLRDQYTNPDAPLATISLLVSPSASERAADPEIDALADVTIPDRAATKDAIYEWRDRCEGDRDGVAIFYAAGHGYQVTHDDASVLLNDFGVGEFPMENTIDVGHVHRGMAGPNLPLTQFYFVDACRTRVRLPFDPSEAARGVALHVEDVPDERVAPIFFGAAPGRASYGLPGKGTIFAQALLSVLAEQDLYEADPLGRWGIQSGDLIIHLEQRVRELARGKQLIDVGGNGRSRPVNFLAATPTVPIRIELDPIKAKEISRAALSRWVESQKVFDEEQPFEPYPVVWTVPAGIYLLEVKVEPQSDQFHDQRRPVEAKPGRPVQMKVPMHA
jgi:Caspase domain